ncbi:Ubiquitin-conjugating enzyme E2 13 [Spatholobus suberectus]|nr:Ubiquitin-conjugating enzyme E2 13 [Spatholobus suberectus]
MTIVAIAITIVGCGSGNDEPPNSLSLFPLVDGVPSKPPPSEAAQRCPTLHPTSPNPPSLSLYRLFDFFAWIFRGLLIDLPFVADLCKNPVDGFSAGLVDETNIFEWSVTIIGPPDTLYEGGFFNAIMSFPPNYPNSPPSVKFTSEIWHPNVYPDGRVCISILHPPGDDPNGYELASERWTPVHTVESIVLSIISMLSSPNDESPANVEAAKEWRERRDEFKKKFCAFSSLQYSVVICLGKTNCTLSAWPVFGDVELVYIGILLDANHRTLNDLWIMPASSFIRSLANVD